MGMERTVSTIALDSFEVSPDRGFLPADDPIFTFGEEADKDLRELESLGAQIPELLQSHKLRESVRRIKLIRPDIFRHLDRRTLLMAIRIYAFLASAYVHQIDEPKVKHIPKNVAVALYDLSKKAGRRFPILSYDLYALNNWRRIDPTGPINVENLDTIQKFVKIRDEPWFILIHVEIEAKASRAIRAIGNLQQAVLRHDTDSLKLALDTIVESLGSMIDTLRRMPEGNSPDVYAFAFRPYIQMFQGITYEGVKELPPMPTFRGETGAQSSIIPSLDVALGVKHAKTDLTDYVADMRNYMPKKHREFIEAVEENEGAHPLRTYLMKRGRGGIVDSYNTCLERVMEFRQKHLEFAVSYIQSKVTDPSGTGGTPFMKWLGQLRDEADAHKIPN